MSIEQKIAEILAESNTNIVQENDVKIMDEAAKEGVMNESEESAYKAVLDTVKRRGDPGDYDAVHIHSANGHHAFNIWNKNSDEYDDGTGHDNEYMVHNDATGKQSSVKLPTDQAATAAGVKKQLPKEAHGLAKHIAHDHNDTHLGDDLYENVKSNIKEDVAALIEGEELTEEFKEKAATIFEAAVLNRVKQEVAKLDEAYEARLDEQVEEIKEGLVEKVDGYLDYVVEQWMTQNEIALESGMKSEILEGFVSGLKSLFEQSYIEMPEEKFDVLGSLEEEVQELRSKLDEQFEANVKLNKEVAKFQVNEIVADLSEDLTYTDKEKFQALVEELEFEDVETFQKKAHIIRESYFTNKKATTKSVVESVITDTPIEMNEEKVIPAHMKGYVSVLDNLK